jgi:hypothetical protein
MSAGSSERGARSFLGRTIKTFGKPRVEAAIGDLLAAKPIEPRAYLLRVLSNRAAWQNVGRNEARTASPNRLPRAIAMVSRSMNAGASLDQAIEELRAKAEFADRQAGEDFAGLVAYYFERKDADGF